MDKTKRGACAVIFISHRNDRDAEGYEAAAEVMGVTASRQPGYLGINSVRDPSGEGITISYWENEAAALAWRAHFEHAATRERGRAEWYDRFEVIVSTVTRDYSWQR